MRATAAYQICLLALESCSSSLHIDMIIIAPVYTINMTMSHMRIVFTIRRTLNPVLLISATAFQLLPIFRETSWISVVPGMFTAAALASILKNKKLVKRRQR